MGAVLTNLLIFLVNVRLIRCCPVLKPHNDEPRPAAPPMHDYRHIVRFSSITYRLLHSFIN